MASDLYIFVDSVAEKPSAKKFNDNFARVNIVQWNLINNGDVEIWTAGAAAAPDNWTLGGVGAAVARVGSAKHGAYAAQISYTSEDSYLYQAITSYAYLAGHTIKAWAWVKCSTPNQARIKVADGVATTASSYHTGDGTWQLLSVIHEAAVGATKLEVQLHTELAGDAAFDAVVCVDAEDIMGWMPSANDLAIGSSITYAQMLEGPMASRPASLTTAGFYYATDIKQRFYYSVVNAEWEAA